MYQTGIQTEIYPPNTRFRRIVIRVGFFLLSRGLQSLSKRDSDIRREISRWDPGFTFTMRVLPDGASMTLRRIDQHLSRITYPHQSPELEVQIKTIDTALRMITARMSVAEAYSRHLVTVKGDVADSMVLIRCINITERYLFPRFMAKRILKRLPAMNFRKILRRIFVYFIGIPFGI